MRGPWRDLTLPLDEHAPVWPGDPVFRREQFAAVLQAGYSATCVTTSVHAGTHVDAPCHVIDGAAGVEAWSLDVLCGPAQVVDCRRHPGVDDDWLGQRLAPGVRRVLLLTGGGVRLRAGGLGHGYLTEAAAQLLVGSGVALVGIDTLSIDARQAIELPAHRALLPRGVAVLEGLDLTAVEPGWWDLCCLPLLITGADGAPARVMACPSALAAGDGPPVAGV